MDAYDRARAIAERDRIRAIVRASLDSSPVAIKPETERERRRRRRGLPMAGGSERIMRNRILRAQSFGLTYGDNRYEYGGNR